AGILAQVRGDFRFDRRRIVAGIERRFLVVRADGFGEAATALEARGIGRVVIDAQEALHAGGFRALTRTFAGGVFGLPDVHDRAELLALLRRARIDRDQRNLF